MTPFSCAATTILLCLAIHYQGGQAQQPQPQCQSATACQTIGWLNQCLKNPDTKVDCDNMPTQYQTFIKSCSDDLGPPSDDCRLVGRQVTRAMSSCAPQLGEQKNCEAFDTVCTNLYDNAQDAITECPRNNLCSNLPFRPSKTACYCALLMDAKATKSECDCDVTSCDVSVPFVCGTGDDSNNNCDGLSDPFYVEDPDALAAESALYATAVFLICPSLVWVFGFIAIYKGLQLKNKLKSRNDKKDITKSTRPMNRAINGDSDDVPMVDFGDADQDDEKSLLGIASGTRPSYNLEFVHLNFWVPLKKKKKTTRDYFPSFNQQAKFKQLINNMSGRLESGKLTGIMGASGAGKTTLLNLISGRCKTGQFSGLRMLNGQPIPADDYSAFLMSQGYVKQHDSFLEDLTVKQNLVFEALIRIPDSTPIDEKLDLVQALLKEVGLEEASESKIGGERCPGISGGQRRRLAIAVELLRLPSILILDEPTSGLDSTSALKLIKLLSQLAKGNRTIVTTIHQPRPEIIDLFDDLLLLGEGGNTIFTGPAADAVNYLQEAGVPVPPGGCDNPGDFLIDAIGLDPEAEKNRTNTSADRVDLISDWKKSPRAANVMGAITQSMVGAIDRSPLAVPKKTKSSRWTQTWVMFTRRIAMYYDTPSKWVPNLITIVCVALVVGMAFSYNDPEDLTTDVYEVTMFVFVMSQYAMLIPYLIAAPNYFLERPHLKRSRDSKACSLISYVASCTIEETMATTVNVTLIGFVSYFVAHLNPTPEFVWFGLVLLIVGVCGFQALIMFLTMVTDDLGFSYNLMFLFLGFGSIYGGVFVTYSHIPSFMRWAFFGAPQMMAFRALAVNDLQCCHLTVDCLDIRNNYIYNHYPRWQLLEQDESQGGPFSWNQTAYEEDPFYCFSNPLIGNFTQSYQDKGNLGRYYLTKMEFGQISKFTALFILIGCAIGFRVLSALVFYFRERAGRNLKERISHEVITLQDSIRDQQINLTIDVAVETRRISSMSPTSGSRLNSNASGSRLNSVSSA